MRRDRRQIWIGVAAVLICFLAFAYSLRLRQLDWAAASAPVRAAASVPPPVLIPNSL